MATVEFEPEPPCDSDDFLGVDLGIDSGEDVETVRVKCHSLKQRLQSAADLAANHRAAQAYPYVVEAQSRARVALSS